MSTTPAMTPWLDPLGRLRARLSPATVAPCLRAAGIVCHHRCTSRLGRSTGATHETHEFLVLECDNRSQRPTPPNAAQSPNLKRIYRIDLDKPGLTDVSDIESLPQGALDPGIVPVTKTPFIDLLDPSYRVSATETIKDVIAEKIEGIACGPKLKDGRLVLYVFSDNDLFPDLPTQIYAFAIDAAAAGISYKPQRVLFPLLWPWELPRGLR